MCLPCATKAKDFFSTFFLLKTLRQVEEALTVIAAGTRKIPRHGSGAWIKCLHCGSGSNSSRSARSKPRAIGRPATMDAQCRDRERAVKESPRPHGQVFGEGNLSGKNDDSPSLGNLNG